MKKILTGILATTLMAGSMVTAFASIDKDNLDFGNSIFVDDQEVVLDGNTNEVTVNGGEDIFLPIILNGEAGTSRNITKLSELDDVRLYVKVTEGKKYIDEYKLAKENGVYGAKISLDDYFGDDSIEIGAEISIKNKKSGKTIATTEDKTNMPDFVLENERTSVTSDDGEAELDIDENTQIVEFDDDTTYISLSGNGFYYNVKASNQDPMYLGVSNDAMKDVATAYEGADLDFINFEGKPEFDFTGSLYIISPDDDEDYYLYEFTSSGRLKASDAKYDADEEAFVVKTRELGKYIISDKELDVDQYNKGIKEEETKDDTKTEETKEETKTPENTDDKKNVNTGSADMVSLAATLAVVSVASAGAVALKKRK